MTVNPDTRLGLPTAPTDTRGLQKRCAAGCGRPISENKQACFSCWQRALRAALARQEKVQDAQVKQTMATIDRKLDAQRRLLA